MKSNEPINDMSKILNPWQLNLGSLSSHPCCCRHNATLDLPSLHPLDRHIDDIVDGSKNSNVDGSMDGSKDGNGDSLMNRLKDYIDDGSTHPDMEGFVDGSKDGHDEPKMDGWLYQ